MAKPQLYIKNDNKFTAYPKVEVVDTLLGGMYDLEYDPKADIVTFVKGKVTHDGLVDLPGTEYEEVMSNVKMFFSKECRERFNKVEMLHKMNIMLYGIPGGGKTSIVNRIVREVVGNGGIVLFNPNPRHLPVAFYVLDSIQPETQVLVIYEELDKVLDSYEGELLTLLDGELQKHNAMYIATTNFINDIPPRILRPGRFPLCLEVGLPNKEARRFYLDTKLEDKKLVESITEKSEGFTIDELREVVRSVYCMQLPLEKTIKRIKTGLSRRKDVRSDKFEDQMKNSQRERFLKEINKAIKGYGK